MAPLTPLDSYLTCPRCGYPWEFINMSSGSSYRCSGCEWFLTLGTVAVPAAPAVPASTVNATNTSTGVIAVTISGGTLTAVTVNGVQVGTTAGTYLVPGLGTINITYTVAPTWTWQLPVTNGAISAGATALPVASGGAYFTAGMQLVVDTGANLEAVYVGSGATGTTIPVTGPTGTAFGVSKAHGSGISFGKALLTASLSSVQAVPAVSPWPALQPSTF